MTNDPALKQRFHDADKPMHKRDAAFMKRAADILREKGFIDGAPRNGLFVANERIVAIGQMQASDAGTEVVPVFDIHLIRRSIAGRDVTTIRLDAAEAFYDPKKSSRREDKHHFQSFDRHHRADAEEAVAAWGENHGPAATRKPSPSSGSGHPSVR